MQSENTKQRRQITGGTEDEEKRSSTEYVEVHSPERWLVLL